MNAVARRLCWSLLLVFAFGGVEPQSQPAPRPVALVYGQPVTVPMPAAFHVFAARLIDWDADGRLDLVAAPITASALYLLRQQPPQEAARRGVPVFSFPFASAPVVGSTRDRWTLFDAIDEAQRSTSPTAASRADVPLSDRIGRTFDIADMDGDGLDDLLLSRNGRLTWLRNVGRAGAPAWGAPIDAIDDTGAPVAFADAWHTVNPEAVDWDGDGLVDIIAGIWHTSRYVAGDLRQLRPRGAYSSHSGHLYLLRNVGTATAPRYAAPLALAADTGTLSDLGIPLSRTVDWDGDGDLDLIVAWYDASLRYYENIGSRTSPRLVDRGRLEAAGAPIGSAEVFRPDPEVGDIDGDGDLDVIVAGHGRAVFWFENVGTRRAPELATARPLLVEATPSTPLHLGNIVTPMRFDVDEDGVPDILAGNEPGVFTWARNVGTARAPVFAAAVPLLAADGQPVQLYAKDLGLSMWGPLEDWDERTSPVPVDWDGDGRWDILTNTMSGRVYWLRNAGAVGAPRFEPPRAVKTGVGALRSQPRSRAGVGDWNGDGTPDVVLPDARGVLTIHLGHRDTDGQIVLSRTIVPRVSNGDAIVIEPQVNHVSAGRVPHEVADWNGDGRLDIVVSRRTETVPRRFVVTAYRNQGTADAPVLAAIEVLGDVRSGHEAGLQVVDWNEDGTLDLLTGDQEGRVWFWDGRGLPR